jgi:hypothetical protein
MYISTSLVTTAPIILKLEDKIRSASYQHFKISSSQLRITRGHCSPKCDVTLTRNLRFWWIFQESITERNNGTYNSPNYNLITFIHVYGKKKLNSYFHEGVKIRRQWKEYLNGSYIQSPVFESVDRINRKVIWMRQRVPRVCGNIFSVSQIIQQNIISEKKSGSMEFISCENVPMITIVHNFSPH